MKRVLLMAAGPVAVGLASLLGHSPRTEQALFLPAVWVGVLFVMLPTLYIGAALLGIAPSARTLGGAAVSALERSSIVFVGLAPALAFLVGTSVGAETSRLLTGSVLSGGALLGMAAFYRLVFADEQKRGRALALFAGWALVSLAIGSHLFAAVARA